MSRVAELESNIRAIFNIPRRQRHSAKDDRNFFQACSALDTIGDTEVALQEFLNTNISFDIGIRYLLAYGVLQAIFMQQDAIKHLALSLGLPCKLPQELKEIREIRNDITGHPTNRNNGKSFHVISRVTLSNNGFEFLSLYSDGSECAYRQIKYKELICTQSQFSEELLSDILLKLRNDENTHRESFMSEKLTTAFHPSLNYFFQKVGEGIRSYEHRQFGLNHFKMILEMIDNFKEKLSTRGEIENIKYTLEDLSYPVDKILAYFKNAELVDKRAAEIFAEYVEKKVDELRQIANEIDEYYEVRI